LGDESNTETVFEVDEDEYEHDDLEDDDVSRLGEDKGFSKESDGEESTVGQDRGGDDDVEDGRDEDVEMEDSFKSKFHRNGNDQDSAFSTKVSLDSLKKGGK
jgi:hypothetical protein